MSATSKFLFPIDNNHQMIITGILNAQRNIKFLCCGILRKVKEYDSRIFNTQTYH